jgi:hypothetical protein
MDNIDDDYLTNLSWLKLLNKNELRSKGDLGKYISRMIL